MDQSLRPKFVVYILVLDETKPVWAKFVTMTVERLLECAVKVLEPHGQPLPAEAYRADKSAYDALQILRFLRPKMPEDGSRIIGLTSQGLFDPRTGIHLGGSAISNPPISDSVIISVIAAMNDISMDEPAEHHLNLFFIRFRRLILHELGHTFLASGHCPRSDCVMHAGSHSKDAVDELGDNYCDECRKKIGTELKLENECIEHTGRTVHCSAKKAKIAKTEK